MSYRAYNFHIPCALVITDDMMRMLCEKIGKNPDDDSIWDIASALEEHGLCVQVQNDVEGEVIPFDKHNNNEGYYMDSDTIAYIACSYYPSLFKAVYKDYNELINEFRETVNGWLPDDFPIEQNLWEIIGVVYG